MKIVRRPAWVILVASVAITAATFGYHSRKSLNATQTKAAVTALTTEILEDSQFAHRRLDDRLAEEFLGRYLDSLDAARMILLKSDEAEFTGDSSDVAEGIRRRGDSSLAQTIFQRYLERLDQRTAYVSGLLKTEHFEFTGEDQCQVDRKDAARPVNLDAAKELWRQNLRAAFLQEKLGGKEEKDIAQTLDRRAQRMQQSAHKFSEGAVLDQYLNALAHIYDPHSDYMDREQLQSFNIVMNHSLAGIGATMQSEDGYCRISDLVPGGPAARSGLIKAGDRVVGVHQAAGKDFVDLVDMPLPQAVDLIRGPKGSTVFLDVIPAGADGKAQRKTIAIVRDDIKIEDQRAKASIVELPNAEGGTQRLGVIDLEAFYGGMDDGTSATADVGRLLRKLKAENVAGVILDLRHNGGGSLEEAISLTGLFIGSGPVVQTRTPDGHVQVSNAHDHRALYDGPLVVLTSRLSASASEIVAGALQDYGRALVVGDTCTFGKGTVQTMVPLRQVMQQEGMNPDGEPGALKVTISKFYRPSGQSTQLAGVKSDIVLPSLTDIPAISEAKLDNPMPWDTIAAASYRASDRVSPCLPSLKSREERRLAHDPTVAWLKSESEALQKEEDRKSVSLNEEKRHRESDEQKAATEAREKNRLAHPVVEPVTYDLTLNDLDHPGLGKPKKPAASSSKKDASAVDGLDGKMADEIVLSQAEQILSDYCGLLAHPQRSLMTQR